jgi:hypothetical protein
MHGRFSQLRGGGGGARLITAPAFLVLGLLLGGAVSAAGALLMAVCSFGVVRGAGVAR